MTIALDRAHPLTHQLLSYGPMTEGAGDPLDLATRRYTIGANNVTWKDDQNGLRYLDLAGVTPSFDLSNPEHADLALPLTLAAVLSPADGGEDGLALQTHDWADDGSAYRGAALRIDTTAAALDVIASFGDGGGATSADERTFTWASVITLSTPKVYAVTIRSSTDATLWVNGIRQAVPTTGGTGGVLDAAGTVFGHIGASTDTAMEYTGGVYAWAIWNRDLSDLEHAEFAAQPWGVLLPPELFADMDDPLDYTLYILRPAFVSEGGRNVVIVNM